MNKRGMTTQLLYTFYLLVFAFVVIWLCVFINSSATNERVNRIYYAEDLGMLLTQMKYLDGDLELEYNLISCYKISIDGEKVTVLDSSGGISYGKILLNKDSPKWGYSTNDFVKKIVFTKTKDGLNVKELEVCKK